MTDIRYAKLYQGIREFLRLEAAAGIVLGVLAESLLSGVVCSMLVLAACRGATEAASARHG